MSVKQLLTKDNWIQGHFAKTRSGVPTGGNDPKAVCWCLVGAIAACYPYQKHFIHITKVREYIANKYNYHEGIHKFNDTHTWEDIAEVIEATEI